MPHVFKSRARRIIVAVAGVAVLAIALAGAVAISLATQDSLVPARAIVVLNGEHSRVQEAIRLYREGCAPEIWLTQDPFSASVPEDISRHPLADPGTAENAKQLVAAGIPRQAFRTLPGAAAGTIAEVKLIAAELARLGERRVVLVTLDFHSRRARLVWDRFVGPELTAIIRHSGSQGRGLFLWWWHKDLRSPVLHEMKAILAIFLGLCKGTVSSSDPARPVSRGGRC